MNSKKIVIAGGGHAGIEAALAVARAGGSVLLITIDTSSIGRMSCNPAIGGLAKGHLVKEIDALGGAMGFFADSACLQFKTLNKSKGRAVWSPRAQVDKIKYSNTISNFVKDQKNISIMKGEVVSFKTKNNRISHALLKSGEVVECSALIITSGTFLNGLIHIGKEIFKAGRFGEKPSKGITEALALHGLKTGRLKTGTPPRVLESSINWEKTQVALGENSPTPFSLFTGRPYRPMNDNCYIVKTNINTHYKILDELNSSAMFSGQISGTGPRYCPSVEDKVFRFKDRQQHQLFIEPEWKDSKQLYLNGFSTSLPKNTQIKALKTIEAFKNIELIRPGYAIEYDYMIPSQLKRSLESKKIGGLFSAGQINGTSGYEEAAAQGLIAGINAFNYTIDKNPVIFTRDESYIGVLIDDLTTKDINEPYRMFTASAEHRLLLRPETAHARLYKKAVANNLLTSSQTHIASNFIEKTKKTLNYLKQDSQKPNSIYNQILRNENLTKALLNDRELKKINSEIFFAAETEIKYYGYIKREKERLSKTKQMENTHISPLFDYNSLYNLSTEAKEKLERLRPETLGQASRIAGVKPSDIASIAIALTKKCFT